MANLALPQLVKLVKILQQYSYPLETCRPRWAAFLQRANTQSSTRDPARLNPQILRQFVVSLIEPTQPQSGSEAGADGTVSVSEADAARNQRLVARVVKTLQRIDKEGRHHATSAPPFTKKRWAQITHSLKSASSPAGPPTAPMAASADPAGSGTQAAVATTPSAQTTAAVTPVTAWDLVHATRHHGDHHRLYDFPSYLPGWARTKRRVVRVPLQGSKGNRKVKSRKASRHAAKPRLLGLDCEMVSTVDGDTSALINLSLVDERGQVLYTTRVRPRSEVKDYRTDITGLTKADMEGVTTTRSEARRRIKEILLQSQKERGVPTILVGHSLSNDLRALRLDHQPCIDTALVFSYKGLPDCTPSLKDLHKLILGQDMVARSQGRHDSVEDAYAALKLVLHQIGHPTLPAPLPAPKSKATKEELSHLLVHSIPESVTEERLLALFQPLLGPARTPPGPQNGAAVDSDSDSDDSGDDSSEDSDSDSDDETPTVRQVALQVHKGPSLRYAHVGQAGGAPVLTVVPVLVDGIQNGRAQVVFKNAAEANAVFTALEGATTRDTMGLPQKKVSLGEGLSVKVRKYGGHNGFVFAQNGLKRPAGVGKQPPRAAKRPRTQSSGKV